ncbi:hypothetical protein [Plantactinospora sp. WMMB782]|uniref:hypothetical protein n=1 Tax=Plantactinospora sp. WMMB782 TaxID=3404121 RepID=UPI003B958514
MDTRERDAFSEAVLQRVAELAWAELRPTLAAQLRQPSTAPAPAARGAQVVSLADRRARRRVA